MNDNDWENYFAILLAIAMFTILIGEIILIGGFKTHSPGGYFTNNICSSFMKSAGNTTYSETVCSP